MNIRVVILALSLLLTVGNAQAAQLVHEEFISPGQLIWDEGPEGWRVSFTAAVHDEAWGAVDLPARLIRLPLARGEKLVEFSWDSAEEISLGMRGAWAAVPRLEGGPDDPGRAASGGGYAELLYLGTLRNEVLSELVFLWRPLRVAHGEALLTCSIRLDLDTGPDPDALAFRDVDRGAAEGGAFSPREFPSAQGSPVDAVIVCPQQLAAEFQTLADWHVKRGSRTVVKTTEWIAANYPAGRDQAENIRVFLRDAYEHWGLRALIIGGDTEQVPTRYAYARNQGTTSYEVPTDSYYACLDGSWNDNGNEFWGEASRAGYAGDDTDLLPELIVGRLPVRTVQEAQDLLLKLIAYRETERLDFQHRIAFLAEVLFPPDWLPGDYINLDGAYFASRTINNLLTPEIEHVALFENYEDPDWESLSPLPLSVQAAMDSMNSGHFAFIDHCGHGFRYNMSVGDGSIGLEHVRALDNSIPFHISLMNCTSTAFDFDCLGENYLRNDGGGAIGVFGTTRNSYPTESWPFQSDYYSRLFQYGVTVAGDALKFMRDTQAPYCLNEGLNRWTYFIITYLGDPLLDIWAGPAVVYDVSAPAAVTVGRQTLDLHVDLVASAFEGARLCVWKDGEVWASGVSDALGDCSLSIAPESTGEITLTVWGANARQQSIPITVGEAAGAYVYAETTTLDDSAAYDPLNDVDGEVDAGESIHLQIMLRNGGTAEASNVSLQLSSLSDSLTVLHADESLGTIAAGGSAAAAGLLAFSAAVGCEDGSLHALRLLVSSDAGTSVDTLQLFLRAPWLALGEWSISDPPEDGGNGDGVWDPDEPLRVLPRWVNLGAGATGALSANLSAVSADLSVDEGDVTLDGIELLTSGSPATGFLIRLASPGDDAEGSLTLLDARGREWSWTCDFNPPAAPTGLVAGISSVPDRISLSWDSSPESDLFGYHVYYRQGEAPEFTRSTLMPVAGSSFELLDLLENTLTEVYVSAVDSGGMESAQSDVLATSTNPTQLPGFPQATAGPSASAVAVSNVAGDTSLELIAAGGYLHVWHHTGLEVRDGDNESDTYGVYCTQAWSITGNVTTLPLIDNGYRQIVVANQDDHSVYVFDHEGQVLPGWPRPMSAWAWCNIVGADLDGDGDLEITALDVNGNLYAWHHDGSELRPGSGGIFLGGIGAWSLSSPAAADMDGDGDDELVVAGSNERLYVLQGDGSNLPGFPLLLDPSGGSLMSSRVPIVLANLDDDPLGRIEILLQTEADSLFIFQDDGSRFPGFPRYYRNLSVDVAPSPLPVDLDGDGDVELLISDTREGGDCTLHLIHHDGTPLPGWPIDLPLHSQISPICGDVDGDGQLEFIVGGEQGIIYGFNVDGSAQAGFPIDVGGEVRGTPALADLDRDGDIELLVSTWNQRVLVWDFPGDFSAESCPWPTAAGNYYRSGLFGDWDDVPVFVSDITLEQTAAGVLLSWRAQGDATRWGLERTRLLHPGHWGEPLLIDDALQAEDGLLSCLDADAAAGETYLYRALAWRGAELLLDIVLGQLELTAPAWRDRLLGAWPNPFNPSTRIACESSGNRHVRLMIYSVEGRLLRTLHDAPLPAGRHEFVWDGCDEGGRDMASGVYLARLEQDGRGENRRLVLLK